MKKTLRHNLLLIIIGLVLASGISVFAVWSNPTGVAPANNIAAPVHTGPSQVKTTGVCTSGSCGGLSVGPFAVFSNAEFDSQVFFKGIVRGDSSANTDSSVAIGDSGSGIQVNTSVNGNLSAVGALESQNVANSQNSTLCAAADGTIVTCGSTSTSEYYAVPVQTLAYPMPDYAYQGTGTQKYILSVCLNGAARRPLSFTVNYVSDTGQVSNGNVLNIRAGQVCSDRTDAEKAIVLSAPHTKVGDARSACTYEGNDTTYQSPAYQGYSVNVDPTLRCQ